MAVTIGPNVYTGKSRLRKLRKLKRWQKRNEKIARKKEAAEQKRRERDQQSPQQQDAERGRSLSSSSASSSSCSSNGSTESLDSLGLTSDLLPLVDTLPLQPHLKWGLHGSALARQMHYVPSLPNDFIGFGKSWKPEKQRLIEEETKVLVTAEEKVEFLEEDDVEGDNETKLCCCSIM